MDTMQKKVAGTACLPNMPIRINSVGGETCEHTGVFTARFFELIPGKRMVELVDFESNSPAFASTIIITTTLTPVPGGTEVAFACKDVEEISGDGYRIG